jgi:hypothetical protein
LIQNENLLKILESLLTLKLTILHFFELYLYPKFIFVYKYGYQLHLLTISPISTHIRPSIFSQFDF